MSHRVEFDNISGVFVHLFKLAFLKFAPLIEIKLVTCFGELKPLWQELFDTRKTKRALVPVEKPYG